MEKKKDGTEFHLKNIIFIRKNYILNQTYTNNGLILVINFFGLESVKKAFINHFISSIKNFSKKTFNL